MQILLLVLLLVLPSFDIAASIACAKDIAIELQADGVIVEQYSDITGNTINFKVPLKVNGSKFNHASVVWGKLEQPKLMFSPLMEQRGKYLYGHFLANDEMKSPTIYVMYGGECAGTYIVQPVGT